MERLAFAQAAAERALDTLEAILEEPYSTIVRDASIQRFEYTFEAVWKLLKRYLDASEGIVCASPKSCFREAFKNNLLDEAGTVTALEMTDDRNRTVHTYHEAVAQAIFDRLPGYRDVLRRLVRSTGERSAAV